MKRVLQKAKALILPPRPDPAQSRRIAESRLLVSGAVAIVLVASIGVRIVTLADANASTRVAQTNDQTNAERGRILDRNGRLLAGNLPITLLHADPSEIMNITEAAENLAPLLPHHSVASLQTLLG